MPMENKPTQNKIAVDLRSLHSAEFSGVEHYTVNVLQNLLESNPGTLYKLFYNGFAQREFEFFHFINAEYIQTRVPNRLLNLSLVLFGYPKLDKLIGDYDTLFMPNWNAVAVSPETKLVLTVHDTSPQLMPEFYSWKSRIWHRLVIAKLIARADRIIAVSEFTKTSLVEKMSVPAEKITVAPLGVDHDNFRPNLPVDRLREVRNRYDLPGDFVLFIGTVEPRKNLARLIAAFENADEPRHLVIVGKLGWKYRAILKQIAQSPKRRCIHLLGYVEEADKPYLLKLARVFAWPSLYEGFGLPVLEAMAVGTPVVTSNVTSLPEVAGDSALLIDPYNIDDIAAAVSALSTDETLREQYIARGLQRSKSFAWEQSAKIIKDVLG